MQSVKFEVLDLNALNTSHYFQFSGEKGWLRLEKEKGEGDRGGNKENRKRDRRNPE
jgi:hypothetical protein